MLSILNGIQGLVNLLFFVAIVGTLVVSWIYASQVEKTVRCRLPVEQNSPYRWD